MSRFDWVFLFLALLIFLSSASADPCRTNFGSCDPVNGLCWGTGRTTHFCSCKAGYMDAEGRRHVCVDVDECLEDNVCPDNAECVNTVGSYECTCRCGYVKDYTGQRCLDASRIDGACEVPRYCKHKDDEDAPPVRFSTRFSENYVPDYGQLRRISKKRASASDRGACKCESGFELNNCGYCIDKDECATGNPCTGFQSTCTNTEGSYYCGCNPGFVLGPCRTRCYLPTQDIPVICEEQDLGDLNFQGVVFRTFVRPIILRNYETCAEGVEVGATTNERFNTDRIKGPDLFLSWTCADRSISVLKRASEETAAWDQWSCWTACKATCWGGLQTRMRLCLNGLPGVGGCNGEGSQKRNCYRGEKCDYRWRKDARDLTTRERNDLIQAMEKYKQDKSVKGFFNAGASHGWPFQCNRRSCCLHGAKLKFLSWHRTIMLNYEEGLSRYLNNKSLGIPYWNWLNTDRSPPDIAWLKTINGRPNPFADMEVLIDQDGPGRSIERDETASTRLLNSAEAIWGNVARTLYRPHNMHEFSESLENSHNAPHVAACAVGGCRISLASLRYAGFDPLFMFHHSQIDRLWAVAQYEVEKAGNTTWTAQTALEALEPEGDFGEMHMPFGNQTINAFPIVQAVNTMRDSYYYEELTGVKYDDLERDGYPVGARWGRPAGEERLFIAHYLQSVEENVYVNYYMNQMNRPCSRRRGNIGRTVIQGTSRPYRNSVPRLTVPGSRAPRLNVDFVVTACYTSSPTCENACPEVDDPRVASMPDPGLVYYMPNQPIDIYKFNWGSGRKFPSWHIDLHSKSQWVFFYGDRSRNVRQVASSGEWRRCDASRGRAVRCNSKVCLLKSGIYFLVDSDPDHCNNGLKMLIVARQ